jgi:serine/threonine protein kinase/WD40 repeat protein/tetratricopeptide (TPR) repeat protein
LADPAFDLLVDGLIARWQAGEVLDWAAVEQEHPEHAGRLRSLAQALEALGDLSRAVESARPRVAPTPEEDLVPGVLGDFRILRELGRGGMGVVYEAEQVSLNRPVALKVLPLAATMDPRQLERFRHEARAAALLHHPHVVPVYGVGCERGVHYYAMQLIDGCSLADVIDTVRGTSEAGGPRAAGGGEVETRPLAVRATVPIHRGRVSFRRVAELVAQAADALEYAHAMGVVHRDVKPANLLLDPAGNVWVTDFGLARLGAGPGLTISGDLLGTLRYMSPEQALARHGLVDHRTDVYSLGATLYELLTLRPAVDGASKQEVLHRLAFEEPVPPRKIDPSIPVELETVTLKALARNPQERYTSAQELADDLRRHLQDRPILARPLGRLQRLRKWSHRHRPLVVALSACLALLALGLWLGAVAYGIRQGELAEERNRFADEKEQARRKIALDLRRVLVGRAEAVRVARAPGYRRRVWADLREAIGLPASSGDVHQVRATVLACLADPVGLDPVEEPAAVSRRELPVLPAGSDRWVRKAALGGPTAVSPDGALVAVAQPAGRVMLFNPQGMRLREERSPLGGVYDLAFAPDGKSLVAGCEQGFVAWALPGPDRWVVRAGNIFSVAISPNGRLLACGGRQLELWSLLAKRPVASLPCPAAGARVEFSADGRFLLAVAGKTPVAGWPVSDTPERRVHDSHARGVPALAFSPDGTRLASVSKDRTVRLWAAASGRSLRTLTGHTGEIEAVTFNPDGSLLATGDFAGTVRVWDARSGDLLVEAGKGGLPGQVWRLQFGAGGDYLAAAGAKGAMTWTVRTTSGRLALEPLCPFPTSVGPAGVIDLATRPGPSELVLLTQGGVLDTYDLARADGMRRLAVKARGVLRSLNFAPSGDRFTFVTPGGTLAVWDWQGKTAKDTQRRAESVAVSADGRWAAVAGPGQRVTILELESGREALTLPPEGSDVWCLAWAPDGTKLAAGLSDGSVAVWDLELVRARLALFGVDTPSTARHKGTQPPHQRAPGFARVVQVNRLRAEGQDAYRRAVAARDRGDHVAERDHLLVALDRYERLARAVPAGARHRRHLAGIHQLLARLEDTPAALRHLDTAARLRERLVADHPRDAADQRDLARCLTQRSRARDRAGRLAEAVDDARRATTHREKLAAGHGTLHDRLDLVAAYHNLGFQLARAGQLPAAKQWYRAALVAGDRLAADFPSAADTPTFRTSRGATHHNLGTLLARTGDPSGAERLLRQAAAARARLADDFPAKPDYASEAGRSLEWLGGALRDLGKLDESARVFREAIRRQDAALGRRPTDTVFRELCCNHQANLAVVLLRMTRHGEAAAAARELPRLAPDDPAGLLQAARLFSSCVKVTEQDRGLSSSVRLRLTRAYSRDAIALARRAVARGLTNAAALLADRDFDPVRNHDEFRLLLDEVHTRKKKAEASATGVPAATRTHVLQSISRRAPVGDAPGSPSGPPHKP